MCQQGLRKCHFFKFLPAEQVAAAGHGAVLHLLSQADGAAVLAASILLRRLEKHTVLIFWKSEPIKYRRPGLVHMTLHFREFSSDLSHQSSYLKVLKLWKEQ